MNILIFHTNQTGEMWLDCWPPLPLAVQPTIVRMWLNNCVAKRFPLKTSGRNEFFPSSIILSYYEKSQIICSVDPTIENGHQISNSSLIRVVEQKCISWSTIFLNYITIYTFLMSSNPKFRVRFWSIPYWVSWKKVFSYVWIFFLNFSL